MKKLSFLLLFVSSLCFGSPHIYFDVPSHFKAVDPTTLPEHILLSFVDPAKGRLPANLSYSEEDFTRSLDEYVKVVEKNYSHDRSIEYRSLGTIQTGLGKAHLAQIDTSHAFGKVRILQCVTLFENKARVLTYGINRKNFDAFKETFLSSFRSLQLLDDPLNLITSKTRKTQLTEAISQLQNEWKAYATKRLRKKKTLERVFNTSKFQKKTWMPFEGYLKESFYDKGAYWQALVMWKVQNQLLEENLCDISS